MELRANRAVARVASGMWAPYSRLFLKGDDAGWALSEEIAVLRGTAVELGIRMGDPALAQHIRGQAVFYASHFDLLLDRLMLPSNRVATAYFHGRPGTSGAPEFDRVHEGLRRHAADLARVQVTHREMHELVVAAGVPEERVFRIPIAVDTRRFTAAPPDERRALRERLGVPATAFAVGSLQKDGVGWGEGLEPKLVKGPDVLVRTLEVVRMRVPELFVVLTGPARGYVKRGLDRLGIPYVHRALPAYGEMAGVYRTLDACLVCSRQEGGPKAALEAMASGVPLVSTRVGQASELVEDGVNGRLADVDDVDALAAALVAVRDSDSASLARLVAAARLTAEATSVEAQVPLWREFFDGFVTMAP